MKKQKREGNQSGQVFIEYILLFLIGIMVAQLLVKGLIKQGSSSDSRGIIINRWLDLWVEIGKDFPDKD